MRPFLTLLSLLLPSLVLAQVHINIEVPRIRFELPPALVVVDTGVYVIEDYDEDLYVVDDRYWVRRGDHWYRAHDHHGGWIRVEHRHVPPRLLKFRPGQYRRWKRHHVPNHVHPARHPGGWNRHDARDRHDNRRHTKLRHDRRKERDHDRRYRQRDRRDHDRGRGHDRGRDRRGRHDRD
jgi:hypothetical protein